jgi:uncharacterized membrane protein YfcA
MEALPSDILLLALAAVLAGLVDAVVGGGGLIQVPMLFSVFPSAAPATLFGTNKLAAVWGTAVAARSYAQRFPIAWNVALPASLAALVFAFIGAWVVSVFPPVLLRKALPFLLLLVAAYVLVRKDFGSVHQPIAKGRRKTFLAIAVGALIGLYDGFFGPGTGSFLIFLFVRVFGFDFLRASAVAKLVNVACNLAALTLFAGLGHVFWQLGLVMAVCNIMGSLMGTRLAVQGGAALVRKVFLLVVAALILKTSTDAFF